MTTLLLKVFLTNLLGLVGICFIGDFLTGTKTLSKKTQKLVDNITKVLVVGTISNFVILAIVRIWSW